MPVDSGICSPSPPAGADQSSSGLQVSGSRNLVLELLPEQIGHVLIDASRAGSLSALLWGEPEDTTAPGEPLRAFNNARLSRSLLTGLLVLLALPKDGSYVGVVELAGKFEISVGSVHRYVATLVAVGLIERNPITRKYRLAHAD
jgi:hypothetical protein